MARGCRASGYLPAFQHGHGVHVPSPGWPWVTQWGHLFTSPHLSALGVQAHVGGRASASAWGPTHWPLSSGVTAFGGECRPGGCGQGPYPLTEHSVLPRGKLESGCQSPCGPGRKCLSIEELEHLVEISQKLKMPRVEVPRETQAAGRPPASVEASCLLAGFPTLTQGCEVKVIHDSKIFFNHRDDGEQ